MKKNLIIFGTGDIAELALFYFERGGEYAVRAFAVDPEYIREASFNKLPVIPTSDLSKRYPPEQADMFVALGYSKVNQIRREKYNLAKDMGYTLATYVSKRATILNGGFTGDNCFVLEDNTIQPFVRIGNNVTLWSGNHIGHHSIIMDHAYLASHIVISGRVVVGEQCFIGVNATLRDNIKVGDRCVIGAGALLLADAEADGVYRGVPSERSQSKSSGLKKI